MNKIVLMIESGWLTKEQILDISLQFQVFNTLKPYQLYRMTTVCKCRTHPLPRSDTYRMPFCDMTHNLHIGVLVVYLVDVVAVRSSGESSLDKEAIRVIKSMPKWKPGKQRGKPVRVKYTVPVNFRLQ